MKKLSNGMIATIIVVAVILVDQAVKIWVKTHFYYGEEFQIADWFRIHFIENNGMAFGMEFGSKIILTWFRIIAVGLFFYYLFKIRHRTDIKRGYVVCVSMITAGALGNVLDCIFYGVIFNEPFPPEVAQLFPAGGGYESLFYGRVVDMLYFPLVEWNWPAWLPMVGGEHFVFFQPIFNVADACLTVSVVTLILFYTRSLVSQLQDENGSCKSNAADDQAAENEETGEK